jgi:hypothetical protein
VKRFYDVVDHADTGGRGIAYELKSGRVRASSKRAKAQVEADRRLMDQIRANPDLAKAEGFREVQWVFFARSGRDGVVGPEPALLELLNKDPAIPYYIYLEP